MEKKKVIEVSKVAIKIGDKETVLTPDQAKELRDVLISLLGGGDERLEIWYPYYPAHTKPIWWTMTNTSDNVSRGNGHTYTVSLNA